MKKLIAFVLAFTMVAAMAIPALAEEGSTTDTTNTTNVAEDGQKASIPVHGTYRGPKDVVSVDVVWDAMNFIYTDASEGTWNPKTHKYENPTQKGWKWKDATETKPAPEITLTNHSNVGVTAAFGFTPNTGLENLTGSFTGLTNNAFSLASAVGTEFASAPSKAAAFFLSGNGITEENKELGSITVTISKDTTTSDTPEETVVSDAAALSQAILGKKPSIKLGSDITVPGQVGTALAVENYTGTIDLNEKTLTFSDTVQLQIIDSNAVTINNGTVKGNYADFVYIKNATVTMKDCKIENSDNSTTMHVMSVSTLGTVYLNNCTLTSDNNAQALEVDGGNVTLSGNTTLTANNATTPVEVKNSGNLTCLAGTYNFNPTVYVNLDKFEVTENDAGTSWTVTAKTGSQT